MPQVPMGSGAVCVEWMSTGRACQSGFSLPILPHLQRHHGCAARSSVFGYELPGDQPKFSSFYQWCSGGLSSAARRPCGDRTRYLISCASTHTHAGRFCPPRRLMGAKVFLWSPGCIASFSFSGPQEKCLRGKAVFVTRSLWRDIETRLFLQLRTKPTNHLFSLHSRAPKATTRSHIFPTSLPQQ